MGNSKEIYIKNTGKMFPPHIVILGYFFLCFIPLVLFGIIKIEINWGFIIIGLFLSIIFAFSTSGVIIDFNKAVYKFYFGILFLKIGKWQNVNKIQRIIFTKGKVGWVVNYGRHLDVDLAAKSHVVYLRINRKRNLVFSGNFDDTFKVAANIAIALNLPIYSDQLVKNERNVQIITFKSGD